MGTEIATSNVYTRLVRSNPLVPLAYEDAQMQNASAHESILASRFGPELRLNRHLFKKEKWKKRGYGRVFPKFLLGTFMSR